MEATFDNKTNLLNANIRSSVDNSILYTITTSHNLWGRTVTILKDANPVFGESPIVGAIYWREKQFVVHGQRRSIHDLKSRKPAPVPGSDETAAGSKKKKMSKGQNGNGAEKGPPGQDDHDHRHHHRHPSQDCQHVRTRRESMPALGDTRQRLSVFSSASSPPAPSTSLKASLSLFTRHFGLIEIGVTQWWRSVTFHPRYWQWAADRVKYQVSYQHEEWQVLAIPTRPTRHSHSRRRSSSSRVLEQLDGVPQRRRPVVDLTEDDNRDVRHGDQEEVTEDDPSNGVPKVVPSASLQIPYRAHLFHRTKAPALHIRSSALLKDEVFLLLVLIYSETRRQERSNNSTG